ncbi:hypothetical protein BGZ91_012389 [Linnemannia elongata]|nr:hypothetical protein BGZ91_012389 [Linnemannia elongata]
MISLTYGFLLDPLGFVAEHGFLEEEDQHSSSNRTVPVPRVGQLRGFSSYESGSVQLKTGFCDLDDEDDRCWNPDNGLEVFFLMKLMFYRRRRLCGCYIKIHESNLKDSRLLNLIKPMNYTLVGFNMHEYDYKGFNVMFSQQKDAYSRMASYVVAGNDVATSGAASCLPNIINTIQVHGYDMVRLDGCTNDKIP